MIARGLPRQPPVVWGGQIFRGGVSDERQKRPNQQVGQGMSVLMSELNLEE